jgi:hypothetical protein
MNASFETLMADADAFRDGVPREREFGGDPAAASDCQSPLCLDSDQTPERSE